MSVHLWLPTPARLGKFLSISLIGIADSTAHMYVLLKFSVKTLMEYNILEFVFCFQTLFEVKIFQF